PLGDEDARAALAEELAKRSPALGPEPAEAARRERKLLLRLAAPASNKARNVQGLLSGDPLARPDRLAAAGDTQRFLIRMVRSNAYFKRHESYLAVLHRLEADRARGLAAAGDLDGAVRSADAAHALLPGHGTAA